MKSKVVISVRDVSKNFPSSKPQFQDLKSIVSNLFRSRKKHETWTSLSGISFDINRGEFVGIMGANGVGKSTILKLISNIYYPSSGSVIVSGRIAPVLELGAGFSEELSGYENIYLNAALLGYTEREIAKSIDQIIAFSELGEKIQMPVKHFSSGMLVRLAFSIAAHIDADILLFDEVLAVGDLGFQTKCLEKIASLHRDGRTIILVTHDPSQMENVCERCIVISNTSVVFDGLSKLGAACYRNLFR